MLPFNGKLFLGKAITESLSRAKALSLNSSGRILFATFEESFDVPKACGGVIPNPLN